MIWPTQGSASWAGAIARRQLSPVEVTSAAGADRELDPTPERVRDRHRRARAGRRPAAEAALRRGDRRPLLGIPIAHKDIYCTRGIRTTARLRAAGRLGARRRRDVRARAPGRRQRHARQAHHARVRVGDPVPRAPLPAGRATRGTAITSRAAPERLRRGAGRRHGRTAPPARTPAARSGGRPRSAASSVSSPPTAAAAGRAFSRCRGRSTTRARWRAPSRTAPAAAAAGRPRPARSGLEPGAGRRLPRAARARRPRPPRSACRRATTSSRAVDPEVARAFEEAMATLRQLGAEVRDVRSRAWTRRPPSC